MSRIFSVALLPSSTAAAAVALESGAVELRCTRTRAVLRSLPAVHGPDSETLRIAYNDNDANQGILVSGGCDGRVCVFDSGLDRQLGSLLYEAEDEEDRATYALWFLNSNTLGCGYEDQIVAWDVDSGVLTYKYKFPRLPELQSSRNPRGKQLVFDACSGGGGSSIVVALASGDVAVLDVRASSPLTSQFTAHAAAAVTSVSCNDNDHHLVASSSIDGTVKLWDVRQLGRQVCGYASGNSPVYGTQFVRMRDEPTIMAWSGESLHFYSLSEGGGGGRTVRVGFPVLCAQERDGALAACGAPPPLIKKPFGSRDKKCCPTTGGGVYFATF